MRARSDASEEKPLAHEADVLEQTQPVSAEATERLTEVPEIADRPEADVLEQSQVVEEEETVDRSTAHEEVSEADWLEQSITESLEEERR